MLTYAHPDTLVTTDWVHTHLDQPGLRLVEIDVDTKSYDAGHIPGAVGFNWQTQTQDQIRRDIPGQSQFERLVGNAGIVPTDTVVLYGDHNNWFAAYGFWLFKIYGHADVRLMDGGRIKWLAEKDKPLTVERPAIDPVRYTARSPDLSLRAFARDALAASGNGSTNLIDVRSPDEFTGKIIAPPGMNETAQRGGHIPGATSIPWSQAVNSDATFKSAAALRTLYLEEKRVDPAKDTIAYCRIGERSSHTWFVLKYLLGLKNVRNYDGSWTEYGNLIGVPVEKP
jgi:thiosulfate/3-mercaptopyruvate sulfurtransferase